MCFSVKFMDRPLIIYRKNLKDSKFRRQSNINFLNKYIKNKSEDNPFKLKESAISKQSKKIIPGKIYTFTYDPLYKDSLAYYDTRPIVLLQSTSVAGTGNNLVSGINLNFLPEKIKISILDQFFRLFKKEIQKDEEKIWENKLSYIIGAINFFTQWLQTKLIFERHPNVNFSFAYRNYITDRMSNLRIIEYDDWAILPFLESKEIVGASLYEIYTEYMNTLIKK